MGTYSCRRIDSRVKRASSSGVRIMLRTLSEKKPLLRISVAACGNFGIYGWFFDYECGFLLKEPIFSSCGSTSLQKGVETTYSLKEM